MNAYDIVAEIYFKKAQFVEENGGFPRRLLIARDKMLKLMELYNFTYQIPETICGLEFEVLDDSNGIEVW